MCMHCSQICNNCKPAEIMPVQCTECEGVNLVTRNDCLYALGYWKEAKGPEETRCVRNPVPHGTCRTCGADLSEAIRQKVKPLPCLYSNIICGYPCKRCERPMRPTSDPCRKQVFAGKLENQDALGI